MNEKPDNDLPRLYEPLGEDHRRQKAQLMASLPTDAPRRRTRTWRRAARLLTGDDTVTTKRRILRLTPAAAAVATVAIGVWLLTGPGGVESVYAQLNEAVANTQAAEWVHFKSEIMGKPAEGWISVDPIRQAVRSPDRISYIDGAGPRHYTYTPADRTLRIEALSDASRAALTKFKQKTFLAVMLAVFERDKETEGGKLTRRTETIEGKAYTVFTLERPRRAEVMALWVDPATKRVVTLTGKGGAWPKPIRLELDYPKTGPANIYELGVPRDARVIDDTTGAATRPARERSPYGAAFVEAIKIVDSREDWPATPEAVVKAYWRARAAKRFDEMAVLWPGSASFNASLKDEKPGKYVFGKARTLEADPSVILVPYAGEGYFRKHGKYNLKMHLTNVRSAWGRYYITSGN